MRKIKLKPWKPRLPKGTLIVSMPMMEYFTLQQKALERWQFMNMMREFFPRLMEDDDEIHLLERDKESGEQTQSDTECGDERREETFAERIRGHESRVA